MPPLTIERITDFSALAGLRQAWQALSACLPENTGGFATWDATWAYLQFHRPANWLVVAMRHQHTQQLGAVFALQVFQMTHQGQAFRACQPLGVGYLPYIEFPVEGAVRRDALQALLTTVLQEQLGIEVALFWPLHQSSQLYLALLEDLGSTPVLKILRFPGNLHEIETRAQNFAHYRANCSSTTFEAASYCQRRLGRQGQLCFTLSEPPQAMPALLATLCQQNQQKFANSHACRHLPQWAAFVPAWVMALSATGQAQLSTLRLDWRVIASGVSFLHKRRRMFYLIDHDPELARFSPSKILLAHLIEQTFQEGGIFCFGAGSSSYKRGWGPSVGEVKAAIIFFQPAARAALDAQLTPNGLNSLGAA